MPTEKKVAKKTTGKKAVAKKSSKTNYVAGQYVYAFKDAYGIAKSIPERKALLGGKGAGLAEMAHIGIRIPDGFTITTEACTAYYDAGRKIPADIQKQIKVD